MCTLPSMMEAQAPSTAMTADQDNRDTDRLARTLLELAAEVERAEWQRFRERVMRGRREKARQGKKTCGKTPYGYVNPPPGDPHRGTLQIIPEEAETVRRIFAWVSSGVSFRQVCTRLNREGVPAPRGGQWGKTTVVNIVRNPAYLGTQVAGAWVAESGTRLFRRDLSNPRAIVVENAHEPIVTTELWEAANAHRGGTSTGQPGMLTGLLAINGRRVHIDRSGGRSFYKPVRGSGPWVDIQAVNTVVWDAFSHLAINPETLHTLLQQARGQKLADALQRELSTLQARAKKLNARLERLVDMRADGEIPRQVFLQRTAATERQLAEIDEATRQIRRRLALSSNEHVEQAVSAVRNVAFTTRLSPAQKRRALRQVVGRVDIQVRQGEKPKRDQRGRYLPRRTPKWLVDNVFFHLHRLPGLATTTSLSVRLEQEKRCWPEGFPPSSLP